MSTTPPTEENRFDPSIQTEDISFRPDELVACEQCGRQNPPNRLNCLYCAKGLAVAGRVEKVAFRQLEPWEKGWNVVISKLPAADMGRIADVLSGDREVFRQLAMSDIAFPGARVENREQAETLAKTVSSIGAHACVISDKELEGEWPPVRLSNLEIETGLVAVDFNTRGRAYIPPEDVALIATGTIETSRTDTLEKRRRGKAEPLNEVATTADEACIDVYSRKDPRGFRIQMSGFDFSCLGTKKAMLASENMKRLVVLLADSFPQAKLVTVYDDIRPQLSSIWPEETSKDHKGLVFAGLGKREFGKSESINNLTQFTKFSRLQWHIL